MMIVRLTRMSYASWIVVWPPPSVKNRLVRKIGVEMIAWTISATCGVGDASDAGAP